MTEQEYMDTIDLAKVRAATAVLIEFKRLDQCL